MSRPLCALALIPLVGCSSSGLVDLSSSPALHDPGDVIEGEFIISADVPESLAADLGLEKLDYDEGLAAGLYLAEEGADLWTLQTALKQKLSGDLQVEPNRPRVSQRSVNDPYRPLQWHFDLLNLDDAWDLSTGAGVTVAVVDSGVSRDGEDTPVNLVDGWDFIGNDSDPHDLNGHGTHVAGTVAEATDNGRGAAGVAFDSTVLAVRVLDRYGSGSSYGVAKGIEYAADSGADVINLSLGASFSTSTERDAIEYAASLGVVIVAATGNEGRSSVGYPAAYPEVIAVGAVGADGTVASYSNRGSAIDVVAPGGVLWEDRSGDGYADGVLQETISGYEFFEGTSMASPHVAGVAALLLSAGASPTEVGDLLRSTASEGGAWNSTTGYGLVDPVAALNAIEGTTPPPAGTEADTTAPVISNVGGWRSGSSLTLTWTTDEPSTTVLDFEVYGEFTTGAGLTTDHEMSFTIDPGASYTFTVIAEDAAGNVSTDGAWLSSP